MIATAEQQRRELVGELELASIELALEGGDGGTPPPPAPPYEPGRARGWPGGDRRREALLMLGLALAFTVLANALVVHAAARFAQE